MSCVMPPGIAARARSARAAERGCLARYSSWIVMGPMITLGSRLRREAEQRHQRGVRLEWQAVHRGLAPPRDSVAGPRRHARADHPPLVVRRVQQCPAAGAAQMRDNTVVAPARDPGDAEAVDPNDR